MAVQNDATIQALTRYVNSLSLSTAASGSSTCNPRLRVLEDPNEIPYRQPLGSFEMEVGERIIFEITFVPFNLVRQYPHRYVGKANRDKVQKYFDENLHHFSWKFFVLKDPEKRRDPLLFVPTEQLTQFLEAVNMTLGTRLTIPSGEASEAFNISFGVGSESTPVPRYAGCITSFEAFRGLQSLAHGFPVNYDEVSQVYREMVDGIYSSWSKVPSKTGKGKNPESRVQKQKEYSRMAKRAQRYLGLRPTNDQSNLQSLTERGWDPSKPVLHPSPDDMKFVCVDIEAWERDNKIITEVGMAVLNTTILAKISPGEHGKNWHPFIQAHHIRVREHIDKLNHRFVSGCPDRFDFGKSQMVSQKDLAKEVEQVLGKLNDNNQQSVILVGHDIGQDLAYLSCLGYNTWNAPHIIDEIDTKSIHQYMKRLTQGRNLKLIVSDVGLVGMNFHNGGNDAVYTLRAMISMAISRTLNGSSRSKYGNSSQDDWSDGDGDDGGEPQRSVERIQHRQPVQQQQPREFPTSGW
ncbi:hypothetical protein F5Y15DRAFT_414850 [Xylariaceae sp. FL0016]|nr:hypothetical protein F5Y15DRAFT_414850 [Xylariaceae sp. FL0016]